MLFRSETFTSGPYGNIAENTTGVNTNRVHAVSINLTTILNATRILNFRLGATRRFEGRLPPSAGKVDLVALGFPARYQAQVDEIAFPTTTVAGYAQIGGGDRIRRGNGVYTLVGEQTEIHGRHTLVYGADIRLYDQSPYQAGNLSGNFSFALSQTQGPNAQVAAVGSGNGLASLLIGFGGGGCGGAGDEVQHDAVGAGDADGRRAADHHRLDRLRHFLRAPAGDVDLRRGQLALIDHHDDIVFAGDGGQHGLSIVPKSREAGRQTAAAAASSADCIRMHSDSATAACACRPVPHS